MRKLGLAPLVLFCIATSQAQTPVQPIAPPGLVVLKFSWRDLSPPGWDAPVDFAGSHTMEDPRSLVPDTNTGRLPAPIGGATQYRRDRRPEVSTRRGAGSDVAASEPGSLKKRDANRYTYQVKVKNVGDLAIKAFDWEYLFLDSGQRTPLGRHRFLTLRRVAPGKSSTLQSTSLAPPTRVIAARGKNGRKEFEERIIIRCVVYSDGTVSWPNAGSERDCDALKKEQSADARR